MQIGTLPLTLCIDVIASRSHCLHVERLTNVANELEKTVWSQWAQS